MCSFLLQKAVTVFDSSTNWLNIYWLIETCLKTGKMSVTKSVMTNDPFHVVAIWIKIWEVQKVLNNMMYGTPFYHLYPPSSIRYKNIIFLALFTCIFSIWTKSISNLFKSQPSKFQGILLHRPAVSGVSINE